MFYREDLRNLFANLNKRKEDLKKNGIFVDGKHYRIHFKGNIMRLPLNYSKELLSG